MGVNDQSTIIRTLKYKNRRIKLQRRMEVIFLRKFREKICALTFCHLRERKMSIHSNPMQMNFQLAKAGQILNELLVVYWKTEPIE